MSARARSTRKAAQAVIYVQEDSEEDEDEAMTSADEGVSRRKKKPAPKRRKVDTEESGEDLEEGEGQDEEDGEPNERKEVDVDFYDIKRVDFSQTLPVEIITEIVSYLSPVTLYRLSKLNKTLHHLTSGPNAKSLWRTVLGLTKVHKVGSEEIDPRKMGALMLENPCELCGAEGDVVRDAYLMLRLCIPCRQQNLIPPATLGEDEQYSDLHPATTLCAISTFIPVDEPATVAVER